MNKIITERAAFCIQSWWSCLKLKKRAVALTNIRNHVAKIQSNELYLEQTIYQNINHVISGAHQAFRFREQTIMFDFNPSSFGVHMKVQEAFDVNRYSDCAVPQWLKVQIEPPNFQSTANLNSVLALMHFNQADCSIVPATKVLDYQRCQMDIDRKLLYLRIPCASVLEARKRALVLAYLTYDMTRHNFVKLSTSQMLETPFDMQNIYEVQELYDLQMFEDVVDVQANLAKQQQQLHQGMILTDQDAKTLENNAKFKSVELNENFMNVDQNEGNLSETQNEDDRPASPEEL